MGLCNTYNPMAESQDKYGVVAIFNPGAYNSIFILRFCHWITCITQSHQLSNVQLTNSDIGVSGRVLMFNL